MFVEQPHSLRRVACLLAHILLVAAELVAWCPTKMHVILMKATFQLRAGVNCILPVNGIEFPAAEVVNPD